MHQLLNDIKNCELCLPFLNEGVNPIVKAHPNSKIAIIGQAPGMAVHKTSIPWNDKSGERLRKWLHVDTTTFYNEALFAIIPMGFCYPGKGKTGDLPPRKECAPKWHQPLFDSLKNLEIIILIGRHAQNYYLNNAKKTLTETVKNHLEYFPKYLVLPHPSPRNNIWMKKNQWFETENLPYIQLQIQTILNKKT